MYHDRDSASRVVESPGSASNGLAAATATENLPRVLRGFFSQFGHPTGWVGGVAGMLMARTANDDRWVVDLSDVDPSDRVLDVGCGPGVTLRLLDERAHEGFVAGVDPSELMLRQASRRNRAAIRAGRMELRLATADTLPYADGTFTRACAVHSIYFWPSLAHGLRELHRVVSPGGRLVLAARMHRSHAHRLDPSRYGLRDGDHDVITNALGCLGFRDASVTRAEGLDRQTMAAVIATR